MIMCDTMLGEIVDTTPAKSPQPVVHKGTHVTLIPLDPDQHSEQLFQCLGGPDNQHLFTYFKFGPYLTKQEFHDWLIQVQVARDNPFWKETMLWSVQDNSTGNLVGIVGYFHVDTDNRSIELGPIIFSAHLQRTTGSTEANYLLIRHAFDDLGYRRMIWRCHTVNEASDRAARRMGFTFEGTLRNFFIVRGHNRDMAFYSIIDKEWPLRKKAFKSWLHSDNFDGQGVQRQSLSRLNNI